MKELQGKVALVTGASRGAGRGIAFELGKAGAIVYVTGRSSSKKSTNNWPGTINDTASLINEAGGTGIPIRCDHTIESEVKSLIQQIDKEQGKIDIIVNNVWGGNELAIEQKPFWELSTKHWNTMFTSGVQAQLITNHYAIPLLRKHKTGIIIHTTFWDENKYIGHFYYDLAKNAINRMTFNLAMELKKDGIAVIAVSPGWMRTELVLKEFATDENHWHKIDELKQTETPHYIGRAVTSLATDKMVMKKSGSVQKVGELAKEYKFTDIDGRYIPSFIIN